MSGSQGSIARILMTLALFASVAACSLDAEQEELTIDDLVELPPEDEHRERWERFEELVRDCMAEEGFQYIPHVQPRFSASSTKARIRGALVSSDDREFVEAYGYGLSAGIIESNEYFASNPNREITRALTGGEARGYGEAYDRCAREARLTDGRDDRYLELSAQVTVLIAELETEIVSDPRLAEMTERWAACMSEKGHSYLRLSDPRDAVMDRMITFVPEELEDEQAERRDRDTFYARLLEEELRLAVDDLDCREESGVADLLPEVMEEAEAEFLDEHRDLLAEVHAIRTGS